MGEKKLSFRERNKVRLAKKGRVVVRKNGADIYDSNERSKILDFFIGFGIFFYPPFFYIRYYCTKCSCFYLLWDWFGERRCVKYGMFVYFGFSVFILLLISVLLISFSSFVLFGLNCVK